MPPDWSVLAPEAGCRPVRSRQQPPGELSGGDGENEAAGERQHRRRWRRIEQDQAADRDRAVPASAAACLTAELHLALIAQFLIGAQDRVNVEVERLGQLPLLLTWPRAPAKLLAGE